MDLEEILRLDMCPFDYGAMEGHFRRDSDEALLEKEAQLSLFLRYMDGFTSLCGLPVKVPEWKFYMERHPTGTLHGSNERANSLFGMREMITGFFRDIMLFSGWEIGCIQMKEEQLPEFFPKNAVSLQEWESIYSCMTEFGALKEKGFRDIKVTVCWNRALYDYHEFSRNHAEAVKRQFADAENVMKRILRKTADPFALGLDEAVSCFRDRKYIMGFFEANHFDMTVSILDMDYNFMVQILILHMLVGCAEKMFGYRQKGGMDGKI
jgi:hypothetical protein